VAWTFGQRSRPSIPPDCTREEVMADIALCGEAHQLRSRLQRARDQKWPSPRKQAVSDVSDVPQTSPPVAEETAFRSSSRSTAPTWSAAARVIPSVAATPALVPSLPSSPTPTPTLAAYDVTLCDRACPICDKTFNTGKPETARKALAKHVNDHSPGPTDATSRHGLGQPTVLGALCESFRTPADRPITVADLAQSLRLCLGRR
jgi:hypothetical protein